MTSRIGFIGLGIMGSRMAANLRAHGYDLIVFNRTRHSAESLLRAGATWASSRSVLASQADVLFTMLPHPDAVAASALGAYGFLKNMRARPIAAPFLAAKLTRIDHNDYEDADFSLRWIQKDLHLAAVSAYEAGVAVPVVNAAKEIYRLAMRHGLADLDFSAIYSFLNQRSDRPAKRAEEHPSPSARSQAEMR